VGKKKNNSQQRRGRDRFEDKRGGRRRYLKLDYVDYRDVATLRKFISERGKLRPRRVTGASRRQQLKIATAVKRARELALLPYVVQTDRKFGSRDRRGRR